MNKHSWVVVGGHPGVADLIATAASYGPDVRAVVVGPRALAEQVAAGGVSEAVWLGETAGVPVEAYAAEVAAVVAEAPGLVLAGRRPAERVLAGAVAATLGTPVLTGIRSVVAEGDEIVVERTSYNGVAQETVAYRTPPVLVLDGGAAPAPGARVEVTERQATPRGGVTVLRTEDRGEAEADLASAARVIGVGRGLRQREDLALIEQLANSAKAEIACSRPLAEGLDWLGRDRYIGVSGQQIAPDLYLAVGTSGQLQHIAGVRRAKVIVSINTDPEAPIVAEADYVLVGDLYDLVPAITEALG